MSDFLQALWFTSVVISCALAIGGFFVGGMLLINDNYFDPKPNGVRQREVKIGVAILVIALFLPSLAYANAMAYDRYYHPPAKGVERP